MLSFIDPAVTPAEAAAYIAAGGQTGWPVDQVAAAAAIMRGQRYVAGRYNLRWLTEWDNDAAPDQVKYAIIEAALIEARKAGSLSAVSNPSTDKVLVQVGTLSWERVKGAGGAFAWWSRLSAVEGLLAGLIGPDANTTAWLERA